MDAMGFVPAEGVIRCELVFTLAGQTVENVFNFRVADSAMTATALELAGKLVDWYAENLQALVPANVILQKVKMTNLDTADGYSLVFTTGLPLVGGDSATAAPNNVTAAIKFASAHRGRAGRGRAYFIGLRNVDIASNVLDSVRAAAIKAAFSALLSIPMESGSAYLVIVSRVIAGIERVVALVNDVISVDIDPTTDSQRRRLPGRGR